MANPTMTFTPDRLEELRMAYNQAIEAGQSMFVFDGHELLVTYASYLIEHLDAEFAARMRKFLKELPDA